MSKHFDRRNHVLSDRGVNPQKHDILPNSKNRSHYHRNVSNDRRVHNVQTNDLSVTLQTRNNLPVIPIAIAGQQFLGLIDSGAGCSIVSDSLFNKIRNLGINVQYLSTSVKLHTVTQQQINFSKCVAFNFKIMNKNFKQQFFVTNAGVATDIEILLGFDFLKAQMAILDIHRNQIRFPNFTIDTTIPESNSAENCSNPRIFSIQCGTIYAKENEENNGNEQDHTEEKNIETNDLNVPFNVRNVYYNNKHDFEKYSTPNQGTERIIRFKETDKDHVSNSQEPKRIVKFKNEKVNKRSTETRVKRVSEIVESENENPSTKIYATPISKERIQPLMSKIVRLKPSRPIHSQSDILLIPEKTHREFVVQPSLNHNSSDLALCTLIFNPTTKPICLSKWTKIATIVVDIETKQVPPDYVSPRPSLECSESKRDFLVATIGSAHNEFSPRYPTPPEQAVMNSGLSAEKLKETYDLRRMSISADDFDVKHLLPHERQKILSVLLSNTQVFAKDYSVLGRNSVLQHPIELTHNFPISLKPFHLNKVMTDYQNKEIQNLLDNGLIEKSSSLYSFPTILVRKKPAPGADPNVDISYRCVTDYRLLNCVTSKYHFPMTRVHDILQKLGGKKYYSTLDLKAAYQQIEIPESQRDIFTFITSKGKFKPVTYPFGFVNSGNYFNELMNLAIGDLSGDSVGYFLDDILLAAQSLEEMCDRLQLIFDRLTLFNLTLDPKKAKLMLPKTEFLGFNICEKGISPANANIGKITQCPVPTNARKVRQFLGMTNYFRNLINNYSALILPLTQLTKKGVKFVWSQECHEAFQELQHQILNKPMVKNPDYSKKFYLACDASAKTIAGILLQKHNDNMCPVFYYSRVLNESEAKYDTMKKELLAIFSCVKNFSDHLFGNEFKILTDCKALTYHLDLQKQPEIVLRWLMYLQNFAFQIEHIPGKSNPSDYFSRETFQSNVQNKMIAHILQSNESLSIQNIAQLQEFDDFCIKIKAKLLKEDSNITKNYYIHPEYQIVMKRYFPPRRTRAKVVDKIVIPKSLVPEVLKSSHVSHFGANKTYYFIKKMYYWPGSFADVVNFTRRCERCLKFKAKRVMKEPLRYFEKGSTPNSIIACDCVGPLTRSTDGHLYVITVIDLFSRYLTAIPVRNIKATTIIRELTRYFCNHGMPKTILTDNGSNYTSSQFKEWLELLGVEHRKTSIYHPSSNGLLENKHKTLKESISCMASEFDWSQRLQFFQLFYNNSVNRNTGYTPSQLYFGRDQSLPLDKHALPVPDQTSSFDKFLKQTALHVKDMTKISLEIQRRNFECESKAFNLKHPSRNFKIGDIVFLHEFTKSAALLPKNNGPWEIVKIFRNQNYLLHKEDKHIKVHVSKIISLPPPRENITSMNNNKSDNDF